MSKLSFIEENAWNWLDTNNFLIIYLIKIFL
jgi:hypothetical protein